MFVKKTTGIHSCFGMVSSSEKSTENLVYFHRFAPMFSNFSYCRTWFGALESSVCATRARASECRLVAYPTLDMQEKNIDDIPASMHNTYIENK